MASIVNKLQAVITPEVPKIFDAVFDCTLDMINKNFEDYPQHRTNFYELLQAVNTHCFKAFLSIPPNQFKLVFDSIVWAFKHTMRNVADTGLNILMQVSVAEAVGEWLLKLCDRTMGSLFLRQRVCECMSSTSEYGVMIRFIFQFIIGVQSTSKGIAAGQLASVSFRISSWVVCTSFVFEVPGC